ncbi:hypothetical protein GQ457_10G014340 [Hibiscus cannabinus]
MAPQNSIEAEGVTGHNGEKKRRKSRKGDNETQDDEGSWIELIRAIEGKIREEVENLLGEMYEKLDSRDNSLESEVAAMKAEMKELKNELRIYQAALKSGTLAEVSSLEPRIDAPRPRKSNEGKDNTIPFNTWKDFQFAFKEHFYPKNAQKEAWAEMRQLKHDGNLIEYVRKFTELKLQLLSLSEDEGYFDFKNGL